MNDKRQKRIIALMNDVADMTIATVRSDGFPQATTVGYVNDGLRLYFGTAENAQKTQNIARNNKVSLTINRSYERWDEIQGLSLGGTATRVTDAAEQDRVTQQMRDKFPEFDDYSLPEEEFSTLVLFRVDPLVIYLLDYSKGFGHTEIVDLRRADDAA